MNYDRIKEDMKVVVEAVDALDKQKSDDTRKGEFNVVPPNFSSNLPEEDQVKADNLYILSQMLNVPPTSLNYYESLKNQSSDIYKALTTSSGSSWIGTSFSEKFYTELELDLKVANLHDKIPMPTNPYVLPLSTSNITTYYVNEAATNDPTKIPASQATPDNRTLTARKLAARVLFSEELSEDSLIPILPWLRQKIIHSVAIAIENATINGDTAATHMDADVTSAGDVRKVWDGYRKAARSAGAMVHGTAFTAAQLRLVRKAMGVYGVDLTQLAWILSPSAWYQLMNDSDVRTVDKFGPQATILKGQLAALDGIPLIVSEYMREDLGSAGVRGATAGSTTAAILVRRDAFLYGVKRAAKIKSDYNSETDQNVLVITTRQAFMSIWNPSSYDIAGMLWGVAA